MAVETVEEKSETTDFQGPVSTYQVVEAKPLASDARFVASELDAEEDAGEATVPQRATVSAPVRKSPAARAAKVAKTQTDHSSNQFSTQASTQDSTQASTKMYVALAAGLGILCSLAVVAFVLLPGKPADTSYDMGTVTSSSTGLKGRLIANWGNRLNYKLTLEPSDLNQLDAFVTAINNPARPLSVDLQLKDVSGTTLCNTPVLLRYDPLKNIPSAVTSDPAPASGKNNAKVNPDLQNQAQIEQSLNNARLVAQELNREAGKDIFQPVKGDDGQISSLAAQGTLPCTKKQYESAASWAFATNFPSIIQPVGPQNSNGSDDLAAFGIAPGRSGANSGSHRERKVATKTSPNSFFSVEADDSLVGYQARSGIVETLSGKSFMVEKRELVASSLKGVDLPIPIHYRCDQFGACALAGLNTGLQRAWLKK